ncbi:16S rRNA (uracil(1498)-N(3))-methyltransferase [Hutsoniella sourekii]|uniref:16S rRNA (uracil(1498)-N(3))-methyltransferase n=1 Tax=Hutsoniella sourekii TaxID=87650 RepID=UPI00048871AB|nr:16S rRNA (uracil(1498)-N(3))-methyltransferase [Hutsoniella sourekii]
MQQYFVTESLTIGASVLLAEEDQYHLSRVMRVRVGDCFEVVDTRQLRWLAEVSQVDGASIQATVLEKLDQESSELPVEVAIACGLSKNDKLDWLVQKTTETGAHTFYPVAMERDVVKWNQKKAGKRLERLEKIAKEAAEQSHRLFIPRVSYLESLDTLIHESQSFNLKLIAYEETAKSGQHSQLKQALQKLPPSSRILCVFGSEGGLSDKEVKTLKEAGFISVSLGPRILRAETAPVYLLSAISYQYEL